jgi:hypothetical protein
MGELLYVSLASVLGDVEYPAVSVAIARFEKPTEDRTLIATQGKTDREIVES